ncbi:MAG TPA: hypothetical protein VNV60_06605 [Holophagaceae bacterium]|nr:hypothetical protein [Holophagaceae bacterium]
MTMDLGCSHTKPAKTVTENPPPSGVVGFDVLPLVDGGAYAMDLSASPRKIWFINGSGAEAINLPTELDSTLPMDIYPLASGGALMTDALQQVWFLNGTQAIRVKEKSALASSVHTPPNQGQRARWAWAMWQIEAHKGRNTGAGDETPVETSDPSEP